MQKYDVTVDNSGAVRFYKPGTEVYHRLDGPAVEYTYGDKFWFQNDLLHRLDGPAFESPSGCKAWYQYGKLHRLDGPAVEYADGSKSWYIDNVYYTEEAFNVKVAVIKAIAKELTVAEISELLGFEVKIIKT